MMCKTCYTEKEANFQTSSSPKFFMNINKIYECLFYLFSFSEFSQCDRHWSLYQGVCYNASIAGQRKTWEQGLTQCKNFGGQLSIVKTENLRKEIDILLDTQLASHPQAITKAAVGMRKVGHWVWINGQNVSQDIIRDKFHFDDYNCGTLHHRVNGAGGYVFSKQKCRNYGFYICESEKREFKITQLQADSILLFYP